MTASQVLRCLPCVGVTAKVAVVKDRMKSPVFTLAYVEWPDPRLKSVKQSHPCRYPSNSGDLPYAQTVQPFPPHPYPGAPTALFGVHEQLRQGRPGVRLKGLPCVDVSPGTQPQAPWSGRKGLLEIERQYNPPFGITEYKAATPLSSLFAEARP